MKKSLKAKVSEPKELRPGITNPWFWFPERPPKEKWNALKEKVFKRDNHTCRYCGHRSLKSMNVHHLSSNNNKPTNLATVCVACHAVLHIGLNLRYKVIEIWKSKISQTEIVRRTREDIASGKSLNEIKKSFQLQRGSYSPKSIKYADKLVEEMRDEARAYLEEPLCAVFVKLKNWQIEDAKTRAIPKGLQSLSPALRGTSYAGSESEMNHQP